MAGAQRATPADPVEYAKAVALVKGRVARWPSAYASGMVVVEYKRTMAAKGLPAYSDAGVKRRSTRLRRWFREEWIDVRTGQPCGAAPGKGAYYPLCRTGSCPRAAPGKGSYYPLCRPSKRVSKATPVTASELTAAQKKHMMDVKNKAGPATVQYVETIKVRAGLAKK